MNFLQSRSAPTWLIKNSFSTGRVKAIACAAVTTIVAGGLGSTSAVTAFAAPSFSGQASMSQKHASLVRPPSEFSAGRHIVTLVEDAVATYEGGVTGFSATSPEGNDELDADSAAAKNYSEFLTEEQHDVAASVGATVDYSYTLALNGFSTDLSAEQAAELSADRRVADITPEILYKPTATSSTDFLGLAGLDGVWAGTGGVENAGEGTVVGIIDTGIAPENPSFAGNTLTTTPGADPYLNGDTINFKKSDGTTFSGVCTAGIQFTAADCNTKLISARYYVNGFGSHNILTPEAGEYLSPRDGSGHGSHTASTTAGNHEVPARIDGIDFGTISGVAPAAKIAAYKVCWEGLPQAGCAMSDMLAAVNQAVKDSVDVINFSIGGGAAQTTVSPLDEAFLGAAAAGIFVAASAGNSGSGASTLDHGSPWITTVAASTIPGYEATATLGDGSSYAGASVTVNHTPVSTPLTAKFMRGDIVAVAGHDPADALLCGPGSLDPAQVRGAIVFCERGVYDRVAKSSEVLRAGGVGMLLVNRAASSTDSDTHSLPTIHLDQPYWDATFAYAAHESAKITFTPNNSTSNTVPTPQVAGFSSRGPLLADGSDILKPDITAPGVAILADIANAAGAEPSWGFMSGTSMASPHIAGLAALYFGEHPHATPAEIKSALMTTAYDTLDAQGNSVKDPFMQGAGHANPTKFFNPGMLYLNNVNDWFSYIQGIGYNVGVQPIDPSNLNLASIAIGSLTGQETITRTVTSTQAGVFEAMPITIPGINAVVSPSTLTFTAAGETKTFDVTFTRTDAPLDTFVTGSLDWVSGSTVVHSPIAIQPKTIVAPALVNGTGINGSTSVTVTPGSTGDIPLQLNGLAAGVHQTNSDDPTSPHTGFARAGQQFSYQVEVPEETRLSRFDLVSADKTGDVDLVVYRLNSNGIPVVGWQSATSSPDERIDLVDPTPGLYRVDVFGYYGETPFEITTFSVLPGLNDDGFTAEPPIIPGQQGIPVSYTLSWEGLTPNTPYLGIVDYANSKTATIISVQPGETPPPNGANQHQ